MAGTINQIAELAGVSRGTVDRALNHRGRVDAEVAERIEKIAEELGYVTRSQKKAERGGYPAPAAVTRRIGVITQLSEASFMIPVRRGLTDITAKLARQGIGVTVRECAGVDAAAQCAAFDELMEEGVDALAIMPVEDDGVRARLQAFVQDGRPLITFNTDIRGVDRLCFVGLDNRQSGRAAAGLLAMLMRGEGKVLGVVGSFSNSAGLSRMDGFSDELRASFPGMTLVGVQPSFDKAEGVAAVIRQALEAMPDIGGILVTSGGQAGVKAALEGRKDRPYIVLHDLTPRNAAYLREGLADFLIDQDGYTQGYRAVSLLADKLRWNKNPEKEYMYTDIDIRTRYTCG